MAINGFMSRLFSKTTMKRRSVLAALAGFAAFSMLTVTAPLTPAHADDEAAEAFVASLGKDAIMILGDETLGQEETEAKFRTILLDAMDIRRVGLFALGQYARLPTPEERDIYFDLLGDFIVEVYLGRLTGYSNEEFVVTGSNEKGKKGREVIVDSKIVFQDGREPLKVNWWLLRNKDGSFKVFDVNVEGIWMAQEQRGTFTSHIRNNGGKFSALIDHLRTQTGAKAAANGASEAAPVDTTEAAG